MAKKQKFDWKKMLVKDGPNKWTEWWLTLAQPMVIRIVEDERVGEKVYTAEFSFIQRLGKIGEPLLKKDLRSLEEAQRWILDATTYLLTRTLTSIFDLRIRGAVPGKDLHVLTCGQCGSKMDGYTEGGKKVTAILCPKCASRTDGSEPGFIDLICGRCDYRGRITKTKTGYVHCPNCGAPGR